MFGPIFYQNQFNVKNFILFFRTILSKSFKFVFLIIVVYFIYFTMKPVTYSSNISFYTNYNESNQSSALSMITNLSSLGDQNTLGFSISDFIISDKFLIDIISQEYTIGNDNFTLIDYWGGGVNDFTLHPIIVLSRFNKKLHFSDKISDREKMIYYAKKNLLQNMTYSEEKKTGLHSISVRAKYDPQLSSDIAENIYLSIVDYYISVTSIKASEKKEFIEDRLSVIKDSLLESEEKLLEFVRKNKDLLSSPKLVLEKERIERDINVYNQLYISLTDQLEMAKIDEKNNTSSIYLLDPANISEFKAGKNFFYSAIQIFLSYFFLVTFFNLITFRKDLFK